MKDLGFLCKLYASNSYFFRPTTNSIRYAYILGQYAKKHPSTMKEKKPKTKHKIKQNTYQVEADRQQQVTVIQLLPKKKKKITSVIL